MSLTGLETGATREKTAAERRTTLHHAFGFISSRSMNVVSTFPAMNACVVEDRFQDRDRGVDALDDELAQARRITANASARVGWCTSSFATMLS